MYFNYVFQLLVFQLLYNTDIRGGSLGWGRQTTFDIVQEICQNDCYSDSLHRVFAL